LPATPSARSGLTQLSQGSPLLPTTAEDSASGFQEPCRSTKSAKIKNSPWRDVVEFWRRNET
jgi:hypothetical protein